MKKVFVAGHRGMVGSSIFKRLVCREDCEVIVADRSQLDLTNQQQVNEFFLDNDIDEIYVAAAKVGGIQANANFPAEFIHQNLAITINLVEGAFRSGITKLLFLGSSCIYPKMAKQPISEDQLLSGYLEATNEPYAVAKIAGLKLCESYNRQYGSTHGVDFRALMPTNLYGPGDNYHLENSHVIPGLIHRFHKAVVCNSNVVKVWGSGRPKREFLYVEDLADAAIYVMSLDKSRYCTNTQPMLSHINVGSGVEVSIKDLAERIANIVGFNGDIEFDRSKPDGTPRKMLDSSLLKKLGWSSRISLDEGLKLTYDDFLKNLAI